MKFLDIKENKKLLAYIIIAYLFSVAIRFVWWYHFKDDASAYWDGQIMINTNDGYFFASGADKFLNGFHQDNPRVFGIFDYGTIFFTTLFAKILPFSLDTITLYMPVFISSLVVIPIILIARLYNATFMGFLSALLGSIAWSYYNRTMMGYYDTDMFSAMAPMFILYFLIKSTIDLRLKTALFGALSIVIYPFLYDQGLSIVYAMGIIYASYMVFYHRKDDVTYKSLILIFISLVPLSKFGVVVPYNYVLSILLVVGAYFFLKQNKLPLKNLVIVTAVTFLLFLVAGNVFGLIYSKIISYIVTGTETTGSLHFFAVNQTVREAGQIPFSIFANRISGSEVGVVLSFLGYLLFVFKHKNFILSLPLVGIGVFALFGGLRFTVYAVPVAALSVVFLFHTFLKLMSDKKIIYNFGMVSLTALMLYPNIKHITVYMPGVVFKKSEVQDLDKLKELSNSKDYTLSWWDYGYPIWYYSKTSTLIDGGKHNNDNFIISKIFLSTSPLQAINLARLSVEKYAQTNKVVANQIFDGKNPNVFLEDMKKQDFKLPQKTRDIYLYVPFKMVSIFPTMALFSNLDLTKSSSRLRDVKFYQFYLRGKKGQIVYFTNGIKLDLEDGVIIDRKSQKTDIQSLDITYLDNRYNIKTLHKDFYQDGLRAVFLKSYGLFLLMDEQTYHSNYVQMFLLGNYDKNLFELVVKSPYSRIYKLKR